MANNFVAPGNSVTLVAGATISAGDVVVIGDSVGIAANDAVSGESITVHVEGIFEVTKAAGTAWSVGDKLDYDVSASNFGKGITEASGDVSDCAICAEAAASGATTAKVKLTPPGAIN